MSSSGVQIAGELGGPEEVPDLRSAALGVVILNQRAGIEVKAGHSEPVRPLAFDDGLGHAAGDAGRGPEHVVEGHVVGRLAGAERLEFEVEQRLDREPRPARRRLVPVIGSCGRDSHGVIVSRAWFMGRLEGTGRPPAPVLMLLRGAFIGVAGP